jgi:anti-sigma regulatory factor (Ser/Thr protein kinase)
MTGHRAASLVTADLYSSGHDSPLLADTVEALGKASSLLCTPPLPGGRGYPPQPAATCALSNCPESVKAGRDFVLETLSAWGMDELADLAELVVSELITNALQHGISSARTRPGDRPVRLRLLAQAPFVMCMVTDPGPDIPVLKMSDPAAESGRGLTVVEACSVRWGWHLLDEGGKVVWALLR